MDKLHKVFSRFKKCFFAGGYVRDTMLKKNSVDKDLIILTRAPSSGIKKVPFKYITLHKEAELYRVFLTKKEYADIQFVLPQNLKNNLKNRDFTVNTFLMDKKGKIYDYLHALSHFNKKLLVPANPRSIAADPVRILRAYRFSADFKFSEKLKKDIKKYKSLIMESPKERVKDEIVKILSQEQSFKIIKKLISAGVLFYIFPPLSFLKGLKQNAYHHLDALSHSILTLKNIEHNQEEFCAKEPRKLHYLKNRIIEMKLAALLHDTGKFEARFKKDGKVHFYKHEKISARLAKECLKNLKFSNKQVKFTLFLIENHMKFKDITKFSLLKQKRLMIKYGRDIIPLLYFCACDRAAARGELVSQKEIKSFFKAAAGLTDKILKFPEKQIKPLITGRDIIKLFGIEPSKEIGRLKQKAYDFQLRKKIKTKKELLKELKKCRFFLPKN